ncbi:PREDICTED: LOW QUALITY PROTEIN: uncharacterized protein LOC109482311 [Branchiostoma belcheri]|uniref:LOW QUALITY PROTEIN: uncharacterized protein LOC109482311 n=1 Tax=Branchiostoma belcheri TaxID=7741 RepID=A0A6P5A2H8_BRABE|nr:PREDICTED: LOW QUALITY PROTEIN: uncharacterized protein LOC109482311 [Branchiostoma belcheri]
MKKIEEGESEEDEEDESEEDEDEEDESEEDEEDESEEDEDEEDESEEDEEDESEEEDDEDKEDEDERNNSYDFKDGSCCYKNHTQGRELLAELVSQRETGTFLDVVVQVDGREFPCHRAVLASTPYFKAMLLSNLTESSSRVIQLREIDSNSFSKILDFLYTGKIRIGKDDVQDILQTAHMLQFDKILQYCREFINDNLDLSNCLGVMRLADMYDFPAIKRKARNMAVLNFSNVTQDEEFLSLSVKDLVDLLEGEHLKPVKDMNEDDIVHSVIRWLHHTPEIRQTAIPMIFKEIRLSCVRVSVLQKLESHPAIQGSAECLAKVTAAKEKHLLGTDHVEVEDAKSHRQETPDSLAIIVGGWKAVKRPHNPHDEQSIPPQPTALQSIICFDPDIQQYYDITTLPTRVSGYMSVASAGRHLYVTGGRVHPLLGQGPHSAPSRQAFRYDFPSDTWLRLPDMPRGRAGHQSVVVDGKLFVVGGDAEEGTSLVTMDCYDPVEGAWMKMHMLPLLRTSSTLKVTTFGDKVVIIEVQESADDLSIDGDATFLLEARIGSRIQQGRNQGKLSVHSLDVKTNVWQHAYTYVPRRSLEHVDILTTTVHDKLYISGGLYGARYIFDAEEETLNKGYGGDLKENVLICERSGDNYRYMNGQEAIMGTICTWYGRISTRHTRLPFALFGHSFLQTKKSSVGWYCRDLEVLDKEKYSIYLIRVNRHGPTMSWDYDSDDDDYYHGSGYDDYEDYDYYGYDSDTSYLDRRKGGTQEDGIRRFENHTQGRELLAELASQRKTGEFLDVVVQVEGREFPCHRAVLASTRYFNTMMSSNLAESSSEVVQLQDVDATSFSKILDFLYTGKICTTKDDVQDILQTAHMLQLGKIVEYCREFIEDNLCQSNCLGVMSLADLYGFSALKKKARDMVVSNFPDVTQEEVFTNLSAEDLTDLLGDEHRKVTNEDDVVDSVIQWLDENPGNHQKAILRILQEIRLSCVKVRVLQKLESHPVIQGSAECLAKITAAQKEKHLLGTDHVEVEDEKSHRQGTPDSLAIIVGGWKAVKRPHNLIDEQSIPPQPTALQSIICFDPDIQQYYHVTTLPTPVSGNMSVASAGRHLYVTGGRIHPVVGQGGPPTRSRQAFRYDFPSDTWLRLADMHRRREGHQSVFVDGKLFVVGGDAEGTSLVTMDCYDPVEGAWMKMHVEQLLRTSPIVKVTAFRDKVVFIEVQEYTEDLSAFGEQFGVQFGVAMLQGSRMGFRMQRSTDEGKLCVHSLDVKTNVWKHVAIYVNRRYLENVDILSTTVHDKLYIRVGYTFIYDLYIFDAEEETLIERGEGDWEETILRTQCEHSDRYVRQDGIVDTIGHYEFGARRQTYRDYHIPLPFALFGHSFLQTKKSSIGWYCRDLAALGKNGKREPGSLSEPTGATSSDSGLTDSAPDNPYHDSTRVVIPTMARRRRDRESDDYDELDQISTMTLTDSTPDNPCYESTRPPVPPPFRRRCYMESDDSTPPPPVRIRPPPPRIRYRRRCYMESDDSTPPPPPVRIPPPPPSYMESDDGSRLYANYLHGVERTHLAKLDNQRKARKFLDVMVQVDGREFPCHRAVLTSTPYFETMLSSNFSESSSRVIQLREIDPNTFSKILDFLYTGKIRIGKDDVQDILQTAHMLLLDKIVEHCREFIEDNLCSSNCLGIMRLANLYGFSALRKKARNMAASNSQYVTQDEEFLGLSAQELADLLRGEHLFLYFLFKNEVEDDVVSSVLKWLDHAEHRKSEILMILQEIHLSCVRVSVLQKLESHPVIRESAECLAKITAAKEKHLLGTQVKGEDASVPRRGISDDLAIIVGGWKAVGREPTPMQSIICFEPDCQQYYHITTLPTPASEYMSVASAGRHLYVTGGRVHPVVGQGPKSFSRQAFRYEFSSDTWLRLPDMPRGWAGHQSVVVDGKLFLVYATSLMTMDCYDPEEGAWMNIHVRPSLRPSSNWMVTASGDKVVIIVSKSKITDVKHGCFSWFEEEGGLEIEGKLCVLAFDVKTKGWSYVDIQMDEVKSSQSLVEDMDIRTTTVTDKLYIRTEYTSTQHSNLYIFNAEENTLTKGDREDGWVLEGDVLRAKCEHSYRNVRKKTTGFAIVDTIWYGLRHRQTPLPFALFGHSFLQTKKSRAGWYCRDLASLNERRRGSACKIRR